MTKQRDVFLNLVGQNDMRALVNTKAAHHSMIEVE